MLQRIAYNVQLLHIIRGMNALFIGLSVNGILCGGLSSETKNVHVHDNNEKKMSKICNEEMQRQCYRDLNNFNFNQSRSRKYPLHLFLIFVLNYHSRVFSKQMTAIL